MSTSSSELGTDWCRWHSPSCFNPQISFRSDSVETSAPYCENCRAAPSVQEIIQTQTLSGPFSDQPPDQPLGELKLWWQSGDISTRLGLGALFSALGPAFIEADIPGQRHMRCFTANLSLPVNRPSSGYEELAASHAERELLLAEERNASETVSFEIFRFRLDNEGITAHHHRPWHHNVSVCPRTGALKGVCLERLFSIPSTPVRIQKQGSRKDLRFDQYGAFRCPKRRWPRSPLLDQRRRSR